MKIRIVFLSLFVAFGCSLLYCLDQEVKRMEIVTEDYSTIVARNSWLVGCVHGIGQYEACRQWSNVVDFSRLGAKKEPVQ